MKNRNCPPLNFGLSENCAKIFFLLENLCQKNAEFGGENFHFGKMHKKIEIFSTQKLFCCKFATVGIPRWWRGVVGNAFRLK